MIHQGINPIWFQGLHLSVTSEESRQINLDPEPKVILSASGMCEAGRIRHHLKHNLWRKDSIILFVGYQAVGTPGRALLEKIDNHIELSYPIETIDGTGCVLTPGLIDRHVHITGGGGGCGC